MPVKRTLILSGPNGSGKTTSAQGYLSGEGKCPMFVNADLITAELPPVNVAAASAAIPNPPSRRRTGFGGNPGHKPRRSRTKGSVK